MSEPETSAGSGDLDAVLAEYHRALDAFFRGDSSPVTSELGYIVEVERYQAKVRGSSEVAPVSLRCTTIFCREQDGWKIIHRHADPITVARSAESVLQG